MKHLPKLSVRAQPHTPCITCPIRPRTLFATLPTRELSKAVQYRLNQYAIGAKEHLYREGDRIDEFYTIFEGWMILYKTLRDGRRLILRFALPGDLIGLHTDFQASSRYSALALTPSVLCAFGKERFEAMVAEHPQIGMQAIQLSMQETALYQERLVALGRKSAEERIAHLLAELFYRLYPHTEPLHCAAPFPITQEEVADAVGLTLVHVNRTLRRLRELGLIECANRRILVQDAAALAQLGQLDPEYA